MKQKINFLFITMLFALCLSACGKQSADQADAAVESGTQSQPEAEQIQTESDETKPVEAEQPETDKTETEETAPEQAAVESAEGFDMERIRKSIIIKGQPFVEVPTALCDLGEGWTWEEDELSSYGPEGEGVATIYYNGEEWYDVVVNNYYEGNEEQGIIFNIAVRTSDCSIDGLIPGETTKQEVVERYGEPTEVSEELSDGSYVYYYVADDNGIKSTNEERVIAIRLDENDVVMLVSITYK